LTSYHAIHFEYTLTIITVERLWFKWTQDYRWRLGYPYFRITGISF